MRKPCFLFGLVLMVGCGGGGSGPGAEALDPMPEATLADDPEAAKSWAQISSAPQIYSLGSSMLTVADFAIQFGGTCPTKTETSDTVTYQGGCSDGDGNMWVGTATSRMGSSGGSITYEGFGQMGTEDCNGQAVATDVRMDGELSYSGSQFGGGSFQVDLKWEGTDLDETTCATRRGVFGIDYAGRIEGAGDETTWSGSGRIGNSLDGVAEVSTEGEVLNDEVCQDEALSGSTTIRAGGKTIAVTYDGMTDCDPEATVQWSFDGQARGELSGVSCAVSRGGRAGAFVAPLLLGLAILVARRQR